MGLAQREIAILEHSWIFLNIQECSRMFKNVQEYAGWALGRLPPQELGFPPQNGCSAARFLLKNCRGYPLMIPSGLVFLPPATTGTKASG